jgi:hypothetical protein
MKSIPLAPSALVLCTIVTTVFAGCGANAGSNDRPALPNVTAVGRTGSAVRSDFLEILRDARIRHHCYNGPTGAYTTCSFHTIAPGTATGPYPGSFTASGGWTFYSDGPMGPFWTFGEGFTISSGSTQIKGSIYQQNTGFGPPFPGVYQYTTTDGYSGGAKIRSLWPHFHERLSGL